MIPNFPQMPFSWRILSALIQLPWMILGAFIFIPLAVFFHAWVCDAISTEDNRPIDRWRWNWMNFVWGNPRDGVSGERALIWVDGQRVPYRPQTSPRLRAWLWSAWRNSTNALWLRLQATPQ